MITKFLKVKNIIEDVISFADYRNISEPQVKKIASDFARKIETDEQLVHRVFWSPVVDHVVDMPIDLSTILQVSYKEGKPHRPKTKMQIVEWSQRAFDDSNCTYKITLDCPKCHEENCNCNGAYVTIDADDIWRQQHPEYQYMHMDHLYRWGGMNKQNIPDIPSKINHNFKIIKYAQHFYHNADYHIKGCMNLDAQLLSNCRTEYTLPSLDLMRLNKPDGEILIAYMAKRMDEEGFHLIPDLPQVIEGIQWFYEEKAAWKEWRRTRDRSHYMAYQEAQKQRKIMQGVCNTLLQTPSQDAWHAFLENRWKRTVKDNNFLGHNNAFVPNNYENYLTQLSRK